MTRLACLIVAAAGLVAVGGCRTAGTTVVQPGPIMGIGDDICAVGLTFDLTTTDKLGQGVGGVELWRVDRHHVAGKAFRLGATDASGHLTAPDCYMASLEYRFWHPDAEPVVLHLMLLREGYAVKHLHLTPSTQDVLEAGNMLGVPPGRSFEWSQIRPPSVRKSFHVVSQVALDAVQQ